jgi:hypothetical protein
LRTALARHETFIMALRRSMAGMSTGVLKLTKSLQEPGNFRGQPEASGESGNWRPVVVSFSQVARL